MLVGKKGCSIHDKFKIISSINFFYVMLYIISFKNVALHNPRKNQYSITKNLDNRGVEYIRLASI